MTHTDPLPDPYPLMEPGELFAGVMLNKGKPVAYLYLHPNFYDERSWTEADALSFELGYSLPTQAEAYSVFSSGHAVQYKTYWLISGRIATLTKADYLTSYCADAATVMLVRRHELGERK